MNAFLFRRGLWLAWFGLIGVVTIVGCSETSQERLPVHPVSGEIVVGTSSAAGCLVLFNPVDGSPAAELGLRPSATTDESGGFALSTYEQSDGAPAGEYVVTIQWLQEPPAKPNGPPPGFAPPVDKFQGKYNNPKTSTWRITVDEGENVLDPITIP